MKGMFFKFIFAAVLVFVLVGYSQNTALAAVDTVGNGSSFQQVLTDEDRFKYLGWWGQINADNTPVFASASRLSKNLGKFSKANRVKVLADEYGQVIDGNGLWYKIDGGAFPDAYVFSGNVAPVAQPEAPATVKIPLVVKPGEYWIDTDLTKQVLTVFQYDRPVFVTYVSTGRIGYSTVRGTYRIRLKFLKTRMRGYNYNLPNVPYTMYYYGSYGIHGTYWHDKFGTRQSAGCTNLTQGDAKYIFDLVGPISNAGALMTVVSGVNPGTVVYNHY